MLPTRCSAMGWGRPGVLSTPSIPKKVLGVPAPKACADPEQPGGMLGQIGIYVVLQARVCWQEEEEEEEEDGAYGISHGEGLLLRVLQERSCWQLPRGQGLVALGFFSM